MKKQLEDVVHVAVVNILSSGQGAEKNYVERDLMLAKVSTNGTLRVSKHKSPRDAADANVVHFFVLLQRWARALRWSSWPTCSTPR